jgi:succinate dehydrogenase / fumarate reductase flavoprotein subunit
MVARAIYTEVKEGRGSPHGGAFLDISHKPAEWVKKKLPSMYHQFMELADVDITKGPMEVGPTTHYIMGGVRVEPDTGASTVPGLFAAGETSGGMHGANRLGGNSLSDLLVFGRRAGLGAAEQAKSRSAQATIDPGQIESAERAMLAPFERTDGPSPYDIHHKLQETMQSLVGIFRVEEDLEAAVREIGRLKQEAAKVRVTGSREFNPGWHLAIDLKAMLTCSEAIARSAQLRKESRGGHARLDFPKTEPEFGTKNTVVKKDGEAMAVGQSPLPEMPAELRAIVDAELEAVKV